MKKQQQKQKPDIRAERFGDTGDEWEQTFMPTKVLDEPDDDDNDSDDNVEE